MQLPGPGPGTSGSGWPGQSGQFGAQGVGFGFRGCPGHWLVHSCTCTQRCSWKSKRVWQPQGILFAIHPKTPPLFVRLHWKKKLGSVSGHKNGLTPLLAQLGAKQVFGLGGKGKGSFGPQGGQFIPFCFLQAAPQRC